MVTETGLTGPKETGLFSSDRSGVFVSLKTIKAGVLDVAYQTQGSKDGWPCILSHGFPYDIQSFAEAGEILAAQGAYVILPYLRGYGPTRFLSETTPRSGEQAALAADLRAFMDALEIDRAILGGYDWGGRASCIVSALWPDRVNALVTGNSYNIQDIARSWEPSDPEEEATFWYQYYFHSERGRRGLEENRRGITHLLWRMWSPTWAFSEESFCRSAVSFDNPDFVEVVIHSYRHRFGLAPGDPAVSHIETQLVAQPKITVPTVSIDGDADGVNMGTSGQDSYFTGPYDFRVFKDAGHNLPQERPGDWAQAVLDARAMGTD